MKKILLVSLALATALATAPAAMATSFTINYSGVNNGNTGIDPYDLAPYGTSGIGLAGISGTLTSTGLIGGLGAHASDYNINGGSGISITIAGYTGAANVVPVSTPGVAQSIPGGGFTYDDIYPASGSLVGLNGLAFQFTSGHFTGDYVELWYGGTGYLLTEVNAAGNVYNPTLQDGYDVAPTPEPSSLLLMGTGLLLMAGFLFRRKALQGAL